MTLLHAERYMSLFTFALAVLCLHSTGAGQKSSRVAESNPRFEDYPADKVFYGKPTKIIWPGDFDARDPSSDRVVFAAESAIQKKPNFAGHYAIVQYGCGTNCAGLVDLESGAVLDNPPYTTIESNFDSKEGVSYKGIRFRTRSRLLVASGCFDWDNPDGSGKCGTKYFEFKNGRFLLLRFTPGPSPKYWKFRK